MQEWVRKDFTAWVGSLEGRILTVIDATFSDPQQRKAMKDVLRKTIWDWDVEILDEVVPNREETQQPVPNR